MPATLPRTQTTHTSVADQLRTAGVDLATLDGRDVGPRRAAAVAKTCEDGTVIAGVLYQSDYDANEEHGVADLRTALAGDQARNVTLTTAGKGRVARFVDATAIVVATRTLPTRTYRWGDVLETGSRTDLYGRALAPTDQPEYAQRYAADLPYARQDSYARDVDHGRVTMAQLRQRARDLGLTGLPRTKADLARRVLSSEQYLATLTLAEAWPGWFADATHLVLRAECGPTAMVLGALGAAIDAGTLAVGTYSGPFATGLFLYDGRDETDAIRAARDQAATWYEERMAELEPVAAQLKAAGHRWFFLGRPTLIAKDKGGQKVVRYWLNGFSGGTAKDGTRCRRQPFGWYSLDELLAEDFIRDAAAREGARPADR